MPKKELHPILPSGRLVRSRASEATDGKSVGPAIKNLNLRKLTDKDKALFIESLKNSHVDFISALNSIKFERTTPTDEIIEEESTVSPILSIQALIRGAIERACDYSRYPFEKRQQLIEKISLELIEPNSQFAERVERVDAQHREVAQPLERVKLPEKAPAIWRDDKEAGDTPPAFIKRHYGQWLRDDATGLTRPDIRRLDPTLYTSLANWLKKNQLPDDCPIPLQWDRVDAEIKAMDTAGTQDADPRWVERLAKAKQRRDR